MLTDADCLPLEPVRELAGALAAASIPSLVCEPPRSEGRMELLERVRTLYLQAYPGTNADGRGLRDLVARGGAGANLPLRPLLRLAVDYLDRLRYGLRPG
jgi:hypothetical protein